MTRDEAMDIARKAFAKPMRSDEEPIIEVLVALGLLKLDKPRIDTAKAKVDQILSSWPLNGADREQIIHELGRAGLIKAVEDTKPMDRHQLLGKVCTALGAAGLDFDRFGVGAALVNTALPAVGLKIVEAK